MKCPKCKTEMPLRTGPFGNFYYCPNQHTTCRQRTISETKVDSSPVPMINKVKATSYPKSSWATRTIGTPYEGTSCACGANEYRIGGGGYCERCGHTSM